MSFQKISDDTEQRLKNFIREYMKAKPQERGKPIKYKSWQREHNPDYKDSVTFDEAIQTLLAGMGF